MPRTPTPHNAPFRHLDDGLVDHAGRHDNPAAHARADQAGPDREAELADVAFPTLVVEAPEDPINPPPHASHLTRAIGNANPVTIAGMAHALSRPVLAPHADAILAHTTTAD